MNLKKLQRWFTSKTVRHATEINKQVGKFLHAQRDILKPENVQALEEGMQSMQSKLDALSDDKTLEAAIEELEVVANENILPYPSSSTRENVEVVLVAIAVAFGIRTFFLQPFKIPTGSMQPRYKQLPSSKTAAGSKFRAIACVQPAKTQERSSYVASGL